MNLWSFLLFPLCYTCITNIASPKPDCYRTHSYAGRTSPGHSAEIFFPPSSCWVRARTRVSPSNLRQASRSQTAFKSLAFFPPHFSFTCCQRGLGAADERLAPAHKGQLGKVTRCLISRIAATKDAAASACRRTRVKRRCPESRRFREEPLPLSLSPFRRYFRLLEVRSLTAVLSSLQAKLRFLITKVN